MSDGMSIQIETVLGLIRMNIGKVTYLRVDFGDTNYITITKPQAEPKKKGDKKK